MRVSPFNEQGDLPSGVHQAMLAEVLVRFGHGAPQRVIVTERLQRVIALAQRTGKLERVFLWGSYVTDKPEPEDIDLFLVMSADFVSSDYRGATRSVFDSATAERTLGAPVFWMNSGVGTELTVESFLEQFQIRRDGGRRGIVEIVL
jgi:predicted nucleotidyltransferase